MKNLLLMFLRDDSGAAMAEYAIVAAAITLPIIAVAFLIANGCGTALSNTGTNLTALGLNP